MNRLNFIMGGATSCGLLTACTSHQHFFQSNFQAHQYDKNFCYRQSIFLKSYLTLTKAKVLGWINPFLVIEKNIKIRFQRCFTFNLTLKYHFQAPSKIPIFLKNYFIRGAQSIRQENSYLKYFIETLLSVNSFPGVLEGNSVQNNLNFEDWKLKDFATHLNTISQASPTSEDGFYDVFHFFKKNFGKYKKKFFQGQEYHDNFFKFLSELKEQLQKQNASERKTQEVLKSFQGSLKNDKKARSVFNLWFGIVAFEEVSKKQKDPILTDDEAHKEEFKETLVQIFSAFDFLDFDRLRVLAKDQKTAEKYSFDSGKFWIEYYCALHSLFKQVFEKPFVFDQNGQIKIKNAVIKNLEPLSMLKKESEKIFWHFHSLESPPSDPAIAIKLKKHLNVVDYEESEFMKTVNAVILNPLATYIISPLYLEQYDEIEKILSPLPSAPPLENFSCLNSIKDPSISKLFWEYISQGGWRSAVEHFKKDLSSRNKIIIPPIDSAHMMYEERVIDSDRKELVFKYQGKMEDALGDEMFTQQEEKIAKFFNGIARVCEKNAQKSIEFTIDEYLVKKLQKESLPVGPYRVKKFFDNGMKRIGMKNSYSNSFDAETDKNVIEVNFSRGNFYIGVQKIDLENHYITLAVRDKFTARVNYQRFELVKKGSATYEICTTSPKN